MSFQPILIDGTWQQARLPVDSFTAVDPSTKTPLADRYPVSSFSDIKLALAAAQRAIFGADVSFRVDGSVAPGPVENSCSSQAQLIGSTWQL